MSCGVEGFFGNQASDDVTASITQGSTLALCKHENQVVSCLLTSEAEHLVS